MAGMAAFPCSPYLSGRMWSSSIDSRRMNSLRAPTLNAVEMSPVPGGVTKTRSLRWRTGKSALKNHRHQLNGHRDNGANLDPLFIPSIA